MVDRGRVTGLAKDSDLTRERLVELLGLAARLKASSPRVRAHGLLAGRAIALVFEKPSTRTRAAFEIAAHSQGAHVSYFGPAASHLGVHESAADTAAVLGRLYDGIAYRGADDAMWKRWPSMPMCRCGTR